MLFYLFFAIFALLAAATFPCDAAVYLAASIQCKLEP